MLTVETVMREVKPKVNVDYDFKYRDLCEFIEFFAVSDYQNSDRRRGQFFY